MDKKTEIGKRIKQRRLELEMTQEDLGKRLNLNKSTIQRYESGAISSIKLPVLQAIAQKLNVDPDWLALKTDEMGYYVPETKENFFSIGKPKTWFKAKTRINTAFYNPEQPKETDSLCVSLCVFS